MAICHIHITEKNIFDYFRKTIMKNFLIYIPPFIEQDRPNLNNHWVILTLELLPQIIEKYNVTVVMGETQYKFLQKNTSLAYKNVRIVFIKDEDLGIEAEAYNWIYSLYLKTITETKKIFLKNLVSQVLGSSYTPEYVLFFMNPISFLKELYPRAKFIGCEAGGLFQTPFPKSWYFDIFGDIPCSYLLKYCMQIRALRANQEQNNFIEEIRKSYFLHFRQEKVFEDNEKYFRQFKYNVLLPLQVSNIYSFDLTCNFKSQFHYLKYVLDNISPNIGVIVTEHPYFPHMNKQWFEYFSEKYKNFLYLPLEQEYFRCSENLVKYCDAILNVSSTVSFLSLWWQKPLISLGHNYFSVFSDYDGLNGLEQFLDNPKLLDKNAILYHFINKYWVLDSVLKDKAYLLRMLDKIENIAPCFEFYEGLSSHEENKQRIINFINNVPENISSLIPDECFGNWPLMPIVVDNMYLKNRRDNVIKNESISEEINNIYSQMNELKNQVYYLNQQNILLQNKIKKIKKKSFSKRFQRIMRKIKNGIIKIKTENSKLHLRILGIKINFNRSRINLYYPFAYLKYSYNTFVWFDEELKKKKVYTVNLGDNIQALSIKNLYEKLKLKKITSIDRDTIPNYKGTKVNLLTNAVFYNGNFVFSNNIHYIFLGFNTPDRTLIIQNKDKLKSYEPIGCRDCSSAQLLREYGIASYVTGCYSIMWPRRQKSEKQKKVFFVGVSDELKKYIPSYLLKNAEFIIQRDEAYDYPLTEKEMEEKEEKALKLLERYRNEAKLVVTPLLHCASPCLGMGIPVILARDEYDDRFSAIKKLTPLYLKENYNQINWEPDVIDLEELKNQMFIHAQKKILYGKFDKTSYKYMEKIYERSPDKLVHNTWTKDMEYSDIMENRIRTLLKMFDIEKFKSVMDLGCGKQTLKKYLADDVHYIPVDQHNHIKTTIIKDFNNGEFLYEKVDAVFCLGIFEYIYNLPDFIKKISSVTDNVVCSYIFYGDRQKPEYVVNKYTEEELWHIFEDEGFELVHYIPENENLKIGRNSLFLMRKKQKD